MIEIANRASIPARGTLFVHACTKAMTVPLEWVLEEALGSKPQLAWRTQPILPNLVRTDLDWQASAGSAARIASALRAIPNLRFEITEHVAGGAGQRFSFTPALGLYRAEIDAHGNIVVGEQQVRALMAAIAKGEAEPSAAMSAWLGADWDSELEPFRVAADGDSVRWLHDVV